MSSPTDRIRNLVESLSTLLEHELVERSRAAASIAGPALEVAASSGDKRAQLIAVQLRQLADQLLVLERGVREDHLAKIAICVEEMASESAGRREADLLKEVAGEPPSTLEAFCEALLDRLIAATGAERAFTLFYIPESTEASVVAARNFRTTNLSLEEYGFSRSVLRRVLESGESLVLDDASKHPDFASETSVRNLALHSVLVVPLKRANRTIGAIYLENRTAAGAFLKDAVSLVESTAAFALSLLAHARLLPLAFEHESPVFLDESRASSEIVGRDPTVLALLDVIRRVADGPATVLIEGESGTGKELVARALHYGSARQGKPFVAINCAAIPENLLESELFGHERGAFTGATDRHPGLIEQASGGTLFLDEVSELQLSLQAKLLRFLQSGELQRLGGRETLKVDVRVVAASSKSLREMTDTGGFHSALFYRLNVIPVRVPPLRERRGDIPLLVERFIEKYAGLYGRTLKIEPTAQVLLAAYSYPGNIRELENLIHRLVALGRNDPVRASDLPPEILGTESRRVSLERDPIQRLLVDPPADLEELRRRRKEARKIFTDQERRIAEIAISEAGGNVTEAAERLGVHRVTLHKIVRKQ